MQKIELRKRKNVVRYVLRDFPTVFSAVHEGFGSLPQFLQRLKAVLIGALLRYA
jgi:hypothetical protein